MAQCTELKRVQLDTTELTADSSKATLTAVYQVIAGKDALASDIYQFSIDGTKDSFGGGLPKVNDYIRGYLIEDINIRPREAQNIKWEFSDRNNYNANAYKVWDYEINASKDLNWSITTNSSGDIAEDLTLAPVYYDETTDYSNLEASKLTNVTNSTVLYKLYKVMNPVGDSIGRTIKKFNALLSFSYTVDRFDPKWVLEYVNTLNSSDITIAGLSIKQGTAVITELIPTKISETIDNEDGSSKIKYRYKVKVSIEIQVMRYVGRTVLLGNGLNAYFGFKKEKRRIQRWLAPAAVLGSTTYIFTNDSSGMTNVRNYLSELKGSSDSYIKYDPQFVVSSSGQWYNYLGYYGPATSADGMWEDIDESVLLKNNGEVYCAEKGKDPEIDLSNRNIEVSNSAWASMYPEAASTIVTLDSIPKNWSTLNFPRKGFD